MSNSLFNWHKTTQTWETLPAWKRKFLFGEKFFPLESFLFAFTIIRATHDGNLFPTPPSHLRSNKQKNEKKKQFFFQIGIVGSWEKLEEILFPHSQSFEPHISLSYSVDLFFFFEESDIFLDCQTLDVFYKTLWKRHFFAPFQTFFFFFDQTEWAT